MAPDDVRAYLHLIDMEFQKCVIYVPFANKMFHLELVQSCEPKISCDHFEVRISGNFKSLSSIEICLVFNFYEMH